MMTQAVLHYIKDTVSISTSSFVGLLHEMCIYSLDSKIIEVWGFHYSNRIFIIG